MEKAYILTVKVAPQDADLLARVGEIVSNRFDGTAITFAECVPFPEQDLARMLRTAHDAGYALAIRKIAEG
jgi:hypothetical protein